MRPPGKPAEKRKRKAKSGNNRIEDGKARQAIPAEQEDAQQEICLGFFPAQEDAFWVFKGRMMGFGQESLLQFLFGRCDERMLEI